MESDESGCTANSIENNNENAITGNQKICFANTVVYYALNYI